MAVLTTACPGSRPGAALVADAALRRPPAALVGGVAFMEAVSGGSAGTHRWPTRRDRGLAVSGWRGGAFLFTVGVALERADTSPGDAGRRIVDVVAERFA